MSFNFGYGNYGMNNLNMMNSMNGMNSQQTSQGYNVFKQMKEQYGCEDCFRYAPCPPNMQARVMPLPPDSIQLSFWGRLKYHLFGR